MAQSPWIPTAVWAVDGKALFLCKPEESTIWRLQFPECRLTHQLSLGTGRVVSLSMSRAGLLATRSGDLLVIDPASLAVKNSYRMERNPIVMGSHGDSVVFAIVASPVWKIQIIDLLNAEIRGEATAETLRTLAGFADTPGDQGYVKDLLRSRDGKSLYFLYQHDYHDVSDIKLRFDRGLLTFVESDRWNPSAPPSDGGPALRWEVEGQRRGDWKLPVLYEKSFAILDRQGKVLGIEDFPLMNRSQIGPHVLLPCPAGRSVITLNQPMQFIEWVKDFPQ